jgi:cytochrome P450
MAPPSTAETHAAVTYNPYATETHVDPFPIYARLRTEAPVYRNDELGFYALSRYDDVLGALHDSDVFCSRHGITLEPKSPLPMMITMDPPEHTKMRRLVSRVFTPRRIAELEPRIRELSAKYLDRFRGDGHGDLIVDYSAKLPMDAISTMLGVPDADQDMLREWTDAMIDREDGNPEILPHGIEGAAKIYGYFADDVARKRAHPGDDLTSGLIQAEVDGERLTENEIIGFCFLLIIAGNETTTKLIGNAMYWLGHRPTERQKILDDRSRSPAAVEETLRYDGSTQLMARTLTRDITMHGTTMTEGSKVLLLLGAANRDPDVFERAEEFDIDRPTTAHVGLGHGIHVCLGASLARLEMRVALEDLHDALLDYEIDDSGLRRINSGNVRGYNRMPITFRPA